MDFNKAALEMHETHHGKVGIVSKVEVKLLIHQHCHQKQGVCSPHPI